jgi:dolichyl-phosphate-mannose-protein mannosyltransferase
MPNPEIAITIHAHTDASSRPSEDFELVRYPTHQPTDWTSSHRQEELPFYMTEDTSARRRVTHTPQGPTTPKHNTQWDDEYDGEGKDVYAKANASQRYGGGGRVARRAPPPPPASIVRLCTASPLFLPRLASNRPSSLPFSL